MKVTHEQKIYQLSFMPRLFPVNCYLVEEDNGLTLVDAGLPFSVKGILKTAGEIGKTITHIMLTHAHGDHIGALDGLKERLPAAQVLISERDARLLAGDRSLDRGEPDTPIRGDVPKPGSIRTQPDVLLKDGDRIGSLLAVSAPGHTPGSMAFLDERSRILLAGDAFQTRGGTAVSGQIRPWFPFPAMATWSKRQALISARKLLVHRPALLAVGHGLMLPDPCGAMEQAINEAAHTLSSLPEERSR